VSLPQRLVIVHPRDLDWALKTATLSDWILLTGDNDRGGGDAQDDALSLGEKHGRALFILEERVKQRLGLTVAPVIVRQVGTRLELTEVRLDRPLSRKAAP
jgi:conjugal transfer pilus assembly protein TraW